MNNPKVKQIINNLVKSSNSYEIQTCKDLLKRSTQKGHIAFAAGPVTYPVNSGDLGCSQANGRIGSFDEVWWLPLDILSEAFPQCIDIFKRMCEVLSPYVSALANALRDRLPSLGAIIKSIAALRFEMSRFFNIYLDETPILNSDSVDMESFVGNVLLDMILLQDFAQSILNGKETTQTAMMYFKGDKAGQFLVDLTEIVGLGDYVSFLVFSRR